MGLSSGRYLLRNSSGNISGGNLLSVSSPRSLLASRRYDFVELYVLTPKAFHTIGVLVAVTDGSARDEGGVVSAGCMLDV